MHCYTNILKPIHNIDNIDNEYITWFSPICISIFYSILVYGCKKLYDSYNNNLLDENLKEYSSDVLKTINVKHNNEYKQNLFNNRRRLLFE